MLYVHCTAFLGTLKIATEMCNRRLDLVCSGMFYCSGNVISAFRDTPPERAQPVIACTGIMHRNSQPHNLPHLTTIKPSPSTPYPHECP